MAGIEGQVRLVRLLTVNGLRKIVKASVFHFPFQRQQICIHVYNTEYIWPINTWSSTGRAQYIRVYINIKCPNILIPCLPVSTFMSLCMSPCLQTESRTKRKRQLLFVSCKRKIEMTNFCLFAANGNAKFLFLGRQILNGNRRLLFQKMCPSMVAGYIDRG